MKNMPVGGSRSETWSHPIDMITIIVFTECAFATESYKSAPIIFTVCLSASNNSKIAERIFMKFDAGEVC
jgi:hypothetical protein